MIASQNMRHNGEISIESKIHSLFRMQNAHTIECVHLVRRIRVRVRATIYD